MSTGLSENPQHRRIQYSTWSTGVLEFEYRRTHENCMGEQKVQCRTLSMPRQGRTGNTGSTGVWENS